MKADKGESCGKGNERTDWKGQTGLFRRGKKIKKHKEGGARDRDKL